MWVPVVLWVLAAFLNACSDTMAHHFDTSVFRKLDRWFWNPEQYPQGGWIVPYTKYRVNSWHLSKSAMLLCIAAALSLHTPTLAWYWEFAIAGTLWNGVFNLSYNTLLRRIPKP